MNQETIKRVKAFAWGMGGFMSVALSAYLANISDIREIEPEKILTIVIVSALGYVTNAITKKLNKPVVEISSVQSGM